MIRLYDAFTNCDTEKLIAEYAKVIPHVDDCFEPLTDEQVVNIALVEVGDALERIHSLKDELTKSEHIFFLSKFYDWETYLEEPERFGWSASVIEKPDYNKWMQGGANLEKTPQCMSYLFVEWKEILSYLLSDYLIDLYGLETCLAVALHEMCFFGVEPQRMRKEHEIIEERLEEVEKAIETGDDSKFVTWSDMKKSFEEKYGFDFYEDTEEAKRERKRASEWEIQKNREASRLSFAALAKEASNPL